MNTREFNTYSIQCKEKISTRMLKVNFIGRECVNLYSVVWCRTSTAA